MFYIPHLSPGPVELGPDEARHIFKVLRKTAGQYIELTDGKGRLAKAIITVASKTGCSAVIEEIATPAEPAPSTVIAISPTKNPERIEWFVEKATEIGLRKIVPLLCARTERHTLKPERLEKIALSAMKQSMRCFMPEITEPQAYASFIAQAQGNILIAHCGTGTSQHISASLSHKQANTVLIGPEGDFTNEEIQAAISAGGRCVSLGSARLRTETAGLYACAAAAIYRASHTLENLNK
jgi:16S rRNA (uracil1498-N3)-methyltransferase